MSTLVKIAFRNVLRHKRRTLLTALTMMAGIGLYIGIDSLMQGMDRHAIENLVNLSESAVKIYTREYDADRGAFPLQDGIVESDALQAAIAGDPRILAAAPRTLFIGELSNYESSLPVVGTIVDPVLDRRVFTLHEFIEGSYFSDDSEREIIIGKRLALELDLAVGDSITLIAQTRYEGNNADDFTVVGLLDTSDPNINKSGAYLTYEGAESFLDLEGLVTELDLKIVRPLNLDAFVRDAALVRDGLKQALPGMAVYTFNELGAGFLELVKQKSSYTVMVILVILLIAGVGIVNTVLMSVYERVREIGVLRAFGFGPAAVSRMFVIEGTIIGLLGSTLGVVFGVVFDLFLVYKGYNFESYVGGIDTAGFPVWGVFYGVWNIPSIIFGFCFGLVIALISSVIPARKAAKLEVTAALRFV